MKMAKYSTIVQWSDEDDGYIAIVPELPGVSAFGETPEQAVKELETAKQLMIKVYNEDGCPLPKPDKLRDFSGQFRVRIPKSLHAALHSEAKKEGLSLNSYINYLITSRHESSRIEKKLASLQFAVLNRIYPETDPTNPSTGSATDFRRQVNLQGSDSKGTYHVN